MLKAVERGKGGRGKKGGAAEYARQMGCNPRTLADWVWAAEVAKLCDQPQSLLDYTTQLSIIHRAPDSDWPDLVERMLAGHWTKEQTEAEASNSRNTRFIGASDTSAYIRARLERDGRDEKLPEETRQQRADTC